MTFELFDMTSFDSLDMDSIWPSVVVRGNSWYGVDSQLMYRSICKYQKGNPLFVQKLANLYNKLYAHFWKAMWHNCFCCFGPCHRRLPGA